MQARSAWRLIARLLSKAPMVAAEKSATPIGAFSIPNLGLELCSPPCRQRQLTQIGDSARVGLQRMLPHAHQPKRFDVGSSGGVVLGVKRPNARSVQLQLHTYASLGRLTFVLSAADGIASKRQLRPSLCVIFCGVVDSAINSPPQDFSQNPSPNTKSCAGAVTSRTLHHSVFARGCCGANATTRTPHDSAFFVSRCIDFRFAHLGFRGSGSSSRRLF